MNNEKIEEGDYVEYVGRQNEKFLVEKDISTYALDYPFFININAETQVYFTKEGFNMIGDTHPIVKKTTPPKKKVVKEFDVSIVKVDNGNNGYSVAIAQVNDIYGLQKIENGIHKAKILIEVEE